MGRAFVPSSSNIDVHGPLGVNWESLVWIDSNTEKPRIGVDELILVSDYRIPENACVIQIRQSRHIILTIKLWRIDLANLL